MAEKRRRTSLNSSNELLDKTNQQVLPTPTDSKQLANEINDFYTKKIEKIGNVIPKITTDLSLCTRPFQDQILEMFEPMTHNKIGKMIKHYEVKTSVEDPIPAMLLKSAKEVIKYWG